MARVRKVEREKYGYFVDHICDAFSTVVICIGIGVSPLMHIESALLLALGYLLLNVYTHISAYTDNVFRISFLKLGPTEVRIMLIVFNTILIFWNPRIIKFETESLSIVDLGAILFFAIFCIVFIWNSVTMAIHLDKIDR